MRSEAILMRFKGDSVIKELMGKFDSYCVNDKYLLIHEDCMKVLKEMPDDSIDVVFTSPPYNDSGKTERDMEMKRHTKYEYIEAREDWFEWQCEVIDELLRVTKRHILYNVQPILNNKADVYRLIGKYASEQHRAVMSKRFASEIIREFTMPEEIVLDPFMGLATTGVCCAEQGREFIGCEIHQPYFEISKDRVHRVADQYSMF